MRYQARLPTIMTTNLPDMKAIKSYLGDRSFDRLNERCIWMGCIWPSHRELVAQEASEQF